jgi:hypothetical protein
VPAFAADVDGVLAEVVAKLFNFQIVHSRHCTNNQYLGKVGVYGQIRQLCASPRDSVLGTMECMGKRKREAIDDLIDALFGCDGNPFDQLTPDPKCHFTIAPTRSWTWPRPISRDTWH